MVHLCEDSSNSLQSKSVSDHVDFMKTRIIQFNKPIRFTDLGRLVDGFNIAADALRIVGVLTEVAIKVTNTLLEAISSPPVVDKFLQLLKVHEADVVDMPICLPVEHDCFREASIARTLWVWRMELASVINSVAAIKRKR